MNARWDHKVVEVQHRLFGNLTERLQEELDRLGLQGWELVSVVQAGPLDNIRLYLKKEH